MLHLTILFTTNRRLFLNPALQCCFFAHMPLMPAIAGRIMFKHIKLFFKDLYNLLLLFSFISYQRSVSESLVLRFPQSEPHRHFFKNTDFLLPVNQFLTLIWKTEKQSLTSRIWSGPHSWALCFLVEHEPCHRTPTSDKTPQWPWQPTCNQASAQTKTGTLSKPMSKKWPNIPYPGWYGWLLLLYWLQLWHRLVLSIF